MMVVKKNMMISVYATAKIYKQNNDSKQPFIFFIFIQQIVTKNKQTTIGMR